MGDELDDWKPAEPPRGFAERVLDAARAEGASRATETMPPRTKPSQPALRPGAASTWQRNVAMAAVFVTVAAGVVVVLQRPTTSHGDEQATIRKEVALGPRAVAVLEPGARVTWDGDRVTQSRGNVFYRVERGAPFRVETAAGEVTVKGTCFRVKVREETAMNGRDMRVGLAGVAVGAAALVGVYEGKVALSHPKGGSVDVTAGQSGLSDARGVRKSGSLDDGERAFADGSTNGSTNEDEPLAAANASLADSVRTYKTRLEVIEDEKKKLEKELADAQAKLAASQDGAVAAGPKKNEFDLNEDDLKKLAQEGRVKARYPCEPKPGDYGPKALEKMGLPPADEKTITAAFAASQKRRWAAIRPLCAQALAGAGDVADKVGEAGCIAIVQSIASQKDSAAAEEAVRLAAEVRAGMRPMPGPDVDINPVERMFLALTGESKAVEADLAKSLGPDDANRLFFSDQGCWHNASWGVGPRSDARTPE